MLWALSSAAVDTETLLGMAPPEQKTPVSFSHVHLYADKVEELGVYKDLENDLNRFTSTLSASSSSASPPSYSSAPGTSLEEQRKLWQSLTSGRWTDGETFAPHGRDVVKQLVAGLNFRVTASRDRGGTRTVLVTSRDPGGVQIIVTALAESSISGVSKEEERDDSDVLYYFDPGT
jgi:hypothetical protein